MSNWNLLYHGWLANYGFPTLNPTDFNLNISTAQHKTVCSLNRDTPLMELDGLESSIVPASLIVSFPKEFGILVNESKRAIESATKFEAAVEQLRQLAYKLPCTETPDRLQLYHSTNRSPDTILLEGLFSPKGYIERFGSMPPEMYGQMSGDGICTTKDAQEETFNTIDGQKRLQGRYPHGKHQYRIGLDAPVVLRRRGVALSIIDWYIKLRHDFGMQVYKNDSIKSHQITSPTCNRIQGLPTFHQDLGYDIIETEFELLVKRRHIKDQIECVGSFQ